MNELELLKNELNSLKSEFLAKISSIEDKISKIESNPVQNAAITESSQMQSICEAKKAGFNPLSESSENTSEKPLSEKEILDKRKEENKEENIIKEEIEDTFFDSIFGKFAPLFSFISNTYNHYKKEQKIPIFILTLSGIVTFLIGFGFLLQYSFINYFNEIGKTVSGFILSSAIIATGVVLSKKNKQFEEFASALFGMSIILNYLTIYFLSSYYKIGNYFVGFVLILLNTALATVLSLKYKTKTVSAITVLGGIFAPFYLDMNGKLTLFYLIYLVMININTLFIAKAINWKILENAAFIISSVVLTIFYSNVDNINYIYLYIIIHLFAYLYFYVSLFSKKLEIKEILKVKDIFIICSNLTLLLYSTYVVSINPIELGFVYIINALIFVAILIDKKHFVLTNKLKSILILISSVFTAFSIPVLFSFNIIGLFFGIEAVLLLVISFIFELYSVRIKSYIMFIISAVSLLSLFEVLLNFIENSLFNFGFYNFVSLGIISYITLFVLYKNKAKLTFKFDKIFYYILKEASLIYFMILFMLVSYHLFDIYTLNLMIIPMIVSLYLATKANVKLTPILGFAHFIFFITAIILSAIEVNSLHFSDQNLSGKLAYAEILFVLFILQFIFEKDFKERAIYSISKQLRLFLYIVTPFLYISYVGRHFKDYVFMALFGSVFINYLLYKITKRTLLKYELYLISYIISAVNFIIFFEFMYERNNFTGIYSLIAGFILFAGIFIYEKLYHEIFFHKSDVKLISSFVIYYFVVFFGETTFYLTENINLAIAVSLCCLSLLIVFNKKIFVINQYIFKFYKLLNILLFINFFTLFISKSIHHNDILDLISVIMIIFVLIIEHTLIHSLKDKNIIYQHIESEKSQKFFKIFDILLLHVRYYILYSFIAYLITNDEASILLTIFFVIHSIFALFYGINIKYNYLNKLSFLLFAVVGIKLFFVDLSGSDIIAKVIVFMIIGAISLFAAFTFQKIKIKISEKMK